jgi:hypothetical protein
MSQATGSATRRPSRRHRLALVATVLLVAIVLCALPFAIQSVVVELVGEPDNTLYNLVSPGVAQSQRPGLAARQPQRSPPSARPSSYLNVVVSGLDESTRVVTLRLSGHRTCTPNCPAYTLVFVSLDPGATQRAAMPPAASVAIKGDAVLLNETVQLPTRGQPSLYPFDTYHLWLGLAAQADRPDGTAVPLQIGDFNSGVQVTLQSQLSRLVMAPPVTVDPSQVRAENDPFDFLSVKSLTFTRPAYIKVLAVLLVLLITVSGCFALFMRPIHDLFLGIGGIILGVWGVRAVIVQTTLPYLTAVDLALSAVILFLLLALVVRASLHFHRQSELHLPWTRRRADPED